MKIITGIDLFEHVKEYDVTLVGTNLYASMAHGFQLQVMINYPHVYDRNLKTKYGDLKKLGTVVECQKEGEPTFALCFISKGYNFRPDLEKDYLNYDALEKCLLLINVLYKGKRVACPLLGVSRFEGNGDRAKVMEIFKRCITDVDLTVYDYEQKSRTEQFMEVFVAEKKVKEKDPKKYYEMVRKRKAEAEERFRKNGHRRY